MQPLKDETPEQYDHRLRGIYADEKKKAREAQEAAEATVKLDAQDVNSASLYSFATLLCLRADQATLFWIPRAELNTLKAEQRLAEKKIKRLERDLPGLGRERATPYTPVKRNADSSEGSARQDH